MNLRDVIFKVRCGNKSGTAFLISNNRALTAYHVITESDENPIYLIDNSGKKVKVLLSHKINEKYKILDVALLEIEISIPLQKKPKFIDFEKIASGSKWITRGFPSAKEIHGDNILEGDYNVVNQQLLSLKNNKIDIELEHSKKLISYAGYSGSPLIINNSIAGIINSQLEELGESKELNALSIKYFRELLESEEIELQFKKSSEYNPNREILNESWLEQQVDRNIKDLGVRYTPTLNVKLDIAKNFDFIVKNKYFKAHVKNEFHDYLLRINKTIRILPNTSCGISGENTKVNFSEDILFIEKSKVSIESYFTIITNEPQQVIDIKYLGLTIREIDDRIEKIKKLDLNNRSNNLSHVLAEAKSAFIKFSKFLNSKMMNLANTPYLLLKGDAGTGKSHLLADVVFNLQKYKTPSIFLLGQHFTSDKAPWAQITQDLLRLKISENELLKTLNEIGEDKSQRILFVIDAINEGQGQNFWKDHINSFVNDFKQYPWICLVLSIRTSYYKKMIPADLIEQKSMISIEHLGFDGNEHEAVKIFFNNYNIELPKVPILNSEFKNPLFLKLFCEGLYGRGLSRIPKGYGGITSVINYFVDNIDHKLGQSKHYDYGDGRKVCRKIISQIIKFKRSKSLDYIPYDDACDIADKIIGKYTHKKGIIEDLIHEGVLSKNIYWLDNDEDEEGLYLAYERFDDHFTARLLLDDVINTDNIHDVFQSNGELYEYIDNGCQGVLEALSIQLPESLDKELFELIPDNLRSKPSIINAFINSLIWRTSESMSQKTDKYINDYVFKQVDAFDSFLDVMFSVAGDESHSYNAETLNHYLLNLSLPERDSFWTTALNYKCDSDSGIGRVLEWILGGNFGDDLSDTSRLLISKAIAWLCTATNIKLRDLATRALVILIKDKLDVGLKLVTSFESVDDPYVYERLLAAIYGAVINSTDLNHIDRLSSYIVDTVFNKKEVYPNVLVRDYARSIIEYALHKNLIQLEDVDIIRPPYNSELPKTLPSNEETDAYIFDWDSHDFKRVYWSQNRIIKSMVTEYGRGTCSYGDFGRYTFQSALNVWGKLDPNLYSNYACKLIFDKFGYNVDLHGVYDYQVNEVNRHENKVERIGKKYQWLALYEVVSRIADNTKLSNSYGTNDEDLGYYQGPWQNGVRNIDPTFIENKTVDAASCSVSDVNYNDWNVNNVDWLISEENLPDPIKMIDIEDFICLQTDIGWKEEKKIGADNYDSEQKNLWYQVRSYLVKDSESDELKDWLEQQDFMGRWMPESSESYSVFSREHYWSPAYKDKIKDNNELGWQKIRKDQYSRNEKDIIAEVLPTAEGHRWEYKDGLSFLAPRDEMFTGMDLSFSHMPSCWFDNNGTLACYDPTVFGEERSELIVNKKILEKFLSDKGFKIIWTVLGEKNVFGNSGKYKNWLDMSGVYMLENGEIIGKMNSSIKGFG